MSKSKYVYLQVIQANYPGGPYGWEDVDSFEDPKEATKMLREYRIAYGSSTAVRKIVRRVLREDYEQGNY